MLNETFYLDGIDARSAGIQLQAPIEFSEAVPIVEIQTIPGRNGDLIFETGSYENRSGIATCFCLQNDVEKYLSSSGNFLMKKTGYRRLETSDDPDHFWLARVENSPLISQRLRKLAPFEIGFDCKPQRFLKSGEIPITANSLDITQSGIKILNKFVFDALPLIKFNLMDEHGTVLYFDNENGNNYEIFVSGIIGEVYVDCDTQNAYNDSGSVNNKIETSEFPKLLPGVTTITALNYGIGSTIQIVPRWWEL